MHKTFDDLLAFILLTEFRYTTLLLPSAYARAPIINSACNWKR